MTAPESWRHLKKFLLSDRCSFNGNELAPFIDMVAALDAHFAPKPEPTKEPDGVATNTP